MDKKKKEQVKPGYLQFSTDNWNFTTRQIEGQVSQLAAGDSRTLSPRPPSTSQRAASKPCWRSSLAFRVIMNPTTPSHSMSQTERLILQGKNKDQQQPSSVPVVDVAVKGEPVTRLSQPSLSGQGSALWSEPNRHHRRASPLIFKAGGKKLIVMPIRLEGPVTVKPKEELQLKPQPLRLLHRSEPATPTPPQEEITTNNPAPNDSGAGQPQDNERNNMAKNTLRQPTTTSPTLKLLTRP